MYSWWKEKMDLFYLRKISKRTVCGKIYFERIHMVRHIKCLLFFMLFYNITNICPIITRVLYMDFRQDGVLLSDSGRQF